MAAGLNGTDAVNVSQLMAEDVRVNNLSNVVNNLGTTASLKYFHANSALADSTAAGTDSVAIGGAATASTPNSVALGTNSIANSATLSTSGYNPGSTALSAATAAGELSIGKAGAERRITNVAAGYSATDAVNVSQLMSEDGKVNAEGASTAAAFGGGASYNPATGAFTNPAYNIGGATYNNVAGALTNLDARVNNLGNSGGGATSLKYFHATSALADSTATGSESVAIGGAANASASNAVALGSNSVADRANSISVGSSTAQRQITNLAAGTAATDAVDVAQLGGVTSAIGGGASVKADGTIAPPTFNVYGQTFANVGDALASINNNTSNIVQNLKYIKFGTSTAAQAQASGNDAVAIGGNAIASANGAVAIGRAALASAVNSVAIGYGSQATDPNTFAVGNAFTTRRIVNVADGTSATDAATVGQVTSDIQTAIANLNLNSSQLSSQPKSTMLTSSVRSAQLLGASTTSSLTPDQMLVAGPTDKGGMMTASGTDSLAIGLNSQSTADYAVAIGGNAQVLGTSSVGIGQLVAVDGVNSVAIGTNVTAMADNAIAIGNGATTVLADGGIAIGNNVKVGGPNTLAIGTNILASGSNSVTLGYGSADGGRANVLSVGSTTKQRQIINVAPGYAATDAVNVSQLTGVTTALGGGATVSPTTGAIVAPAYNVAGNTFNNVGAALTALDAGEKAINNNVMNVTNVVNNITNGGGIKYFHANSTLADSSAKGMDSVAIGGNAVANTSNSVALGANSVASAATLSSAGFAPGGFSISAPTAAGEVSIGAQGAERRITNVAAGYAATDAVNVSQLMAEDQKVNGVSNNLSNLSNTVNNMAAGGGSMKYFHANSSLVDSTASGTNAIGVGPQATAAGTNAIAIGYNASATAANSVALGSNSTTTANLSAAAYNPGSATLSGTTAAGEVSIGYAGAERRLTNLAAGSAATDAVNVSQLTAEDAKVNAEGAGTAAALGGGSSYNPSTGAITNPTYNVAGATYNNVAGALTGVDGRMNNLGNTITYMNNVINNTVINGGGIKYFHANSTLADSTASGTNSVAIGGGANATASNSVALGSNSTTTANLSAAAYNPGSATLSGTTAAGEVSIGYAGAERRLTNLAAGSAATDAVNVSQLTAEDAKVNAEGAATAAALGGGSSYNPSTGAITNPTYNVAGATYNNVAGALTGVDGRMNNLGNTITYMNNVINNTVINGGGIKYFHANSTLADSTASGTNSVAIGGGAIATASNSVALGSNSTTTANLSAAAYNPGSATLSGTTAAGEVSIGYAGAERRLTNLAAGSAATDAVNVSQLTAEDAKVNAEGAGTAAALGGGSSYNPSTGAITNPTYNVAGSTSNNVAGALTSIDARINNIAVGGGIKYFHANSTLADSTASGANSVAIGGAAIATASNSVALGASSTTTSNLSAAAFNPGGTLSGATAAGEVSVGSATVNRRITNLAAGAAATDAVNVSQLMAEDAKVNNVGNNLSNLTNVVNNIANGGANMKYFNVSSSLAAASATGTDSVAAGPNAIATASGAVALGANSVADRANTVSVGSSGAQRQIVNVAAGTNQTDAVNVSQLAGVTAALGAGASVNPTTGAIVAPAYNVLGATYSNVGSALDAFLSASSNLQTNLKYINFGPSTAAKSQASGSDSIAIGGNAIASANGALAIGRGAVASASNTVALGYGSQATEINTFAVGNAFTQRRIVNVADGVNTSDAATVGQVTSDIQAAISKLNLSSTVSQPKLLSSAAVRSTALLGDPINSSLTPDQMLVAGPTDKVNMMTASGTDSLAIGLNSQATADYAVAIGGNAQVLGTSSVGIGQQVAVDGVNSVAIGTNVTAMANNAIAIGNNSTTVLADNGMAIGNNVKVGGPNTLGIGSNIVASGSNSIVLGYASADGGRANVLAVGNSTLQRQIVNVAAGTQKTDAVNVSQLTGAVSALGGGATINPATGGVVAPAYALAGTTYVNVGAALSSLDTRIASGGDPLAVDYDSATKDQITLKGASGTKITGLTAGALSASSTDAVNGSQLYAQGASTAQALGGGASVNPATGAITGPQYTFGGSTYTNVGDALTALNNAAGSGNALGVVYDGQDKSQITLAGANGTKITKLAAGSVNASSTDAVNGTQLYNVAASVADAIGGGSTVNNDGTITNPTYVVGGSTVTNVAGAITNIDARVLANSTDITNLQTQINEGGIGLVTQDATTGNILVASKTGGSTVDFSGMAGARVLTGVAAGRVNASSLDAVNGTQLYNVAASTANAIGGGSTVKSDGTISNPMYNVGGATVTTVGGAITNLDARVLANTTAITNLQTQINEGGIGLVTQDATTGNILVAKQKTGSVVDFSGSAGARILSGIAAGVGANDAVNVGQLQAAGIINPDGKVKAAVTYDTDASGKTDYSSVTLGDGTSNATPVTIHNVAAGSQSTDAVNYSQYADLVAKVNNISNAGTGVDTLFVGDGDRNTEAAQAGGSHATAMGALSVASGSQSVATGYAANASGQNAVATGANANASGNNSVALGAGSVADQDNTVSVGSATQQRRITNVAAGTATTDAVNVGQLNDAIAQANASVDDKVNQGVQSANAYTNQQVNKLDKKMNSLGAAAMAATSLIPNARAEGNFQMSAAAGTYGGAAAIAVGANYWVNDRVLVNAHVTRSTGYGASTGASVGATIGF